MFTGVSLVQEIMNKLTTAVQMCPSSNLHKAELWEQMPFLSLGHFIAVPATLSSIIKAHLKQHENDISITELPLLLSGQSAEKAQPINQGALQDLHIQTAFFERWGWGTLNERAYKVSENGGHLSFQHKNLLRALCSMLLSGFSKQDVHIYCDPK